MANRYMTRNYQTLEKAPVGIFCRFTVGATGAPTLDTLNSKGVKSITRNAVGKYTVVLQDTYNFLNIVNWFSVFATPAAINAFVVSDSTGTVGNPNFVIQFQSAAGTNVELANGEDIRMEFVFRNTTAI